MPDSGRSSSCFFASLHAYSLCSRRMAFFALLGQLFDTVVDLQSANENDVGQPRSSPDFY